MFGAASLSGKESNRLGAHLLDLALLALLVWGIYFSRMTFLPLCGEEPRRAEVAREMLRSGNWIVPTQQGHLYLSRPPFQNWLIALGGIIRGEVDAVAIRLPSVLSTGVLAAGIYLYSLGFVSRLGAITSAAAFTTMGQVLQIGGMGESDALFALCVGGALLFWHYGWARNWWPPLVWAIAGILAGFGALTKGVQGAVYFFGPIVVYLILFGTCRMQLVRWLPVALLSFGAVAGSWTLAYWWATDWEATRRIWFGQVEQRLSWSGLTEHMLLHPLETFACWLPWSPLLGFFIWKELRRQLGEAKQAAIFWLGALAVTYPTVWLVPAAANRYYLPLYPGVAFLVGLAVDRAWHLKWAAILGRSYRAFLIVIAGIALGAALVLTAAVWLPVDFAVRIRQPVVWLVPLWILGAFLGGLVWWGRNENVLQSLRFTYTTVLAVAALVGYAHTGLVLNGLRLAANDPGPSIAALKGELPDSEKLVSFGPVFHRFRYCWEHPIPRRDIPQIAEEVSPGQLFCIEVTGTKEKGGGKNVQKNTQPQFTLPELPFRWEMLAAIPCGRNRNEKVQPVVIVGRVLGAEDIAENPRPNLR